MTSSPQISTDVLVVGSGAAGLSAAISARLVGADVLVIEKAPLVGGTTARSGGWAWIPLSPQATAAGIVDSEEEVLAYLKEETAGMLSEPHLRAFLRAGPEMLALYAARTQLRLDMSAAFPDYHSDRPGAKAGGRALSSVPLRGEELGDLLPLLAPPLRELSLAGMVIGSGHELAHFFDAKRSLKSALFVAKRFASHFADLVRHGRGMRLANGNALAGRLLLSAAKLGIPIRTATGAVRLVVSDGRVSGVVANGPEGQMTIVARRGVVLATGGFPNDIARRRALYAHPAGPDEHFSLAPSTNTGDGQRLAIEAGAAIGDGLTQNAAWAPVSVFTWPDGTRGTYPHFVDRGKPGIIAVTSDGRRFVNESASYHDFISALLGLNRGSEPPQAYFIADSRALDRYGLGMARPFPFPRKHWLETGYLLSAPTIEALAAKAGIDPGNLAETLRRFNDKAASGEDPDFGRGQTAYDRFQGDASHAPNPCLAPLSKPSYFAVRIRPGDIGTFEGLLTDPDTRILDRGGMPLPGLFAAGNDARSLMCGAYPGGGITLGPALVFGFIAGRTAAAERI
jgi:succinate dehydrogenase/fumarate reductase flavoprotein subunit